MAVTETPRHQLKKYGAGTDPHPNRGTFNTEVEKLEALPALKQGSAGSRPAAGVGKVLYWDESTKRLHLDDGTAWQEVTPIGGGGAGRNITAGGAGSEGTSVRAARADHTHVIAIATAAADGAMPKADKAKLDAATASNVPSTVVQRNADGNFSVAPPTSGTHASTKAYVDALVAPLAVHEWVLLLAGENLDSKVTTGDYHNNLDVNAKEELNYPFARAGHLKVNAIGAFGYQTYHTYGSTNRRFHRTRYSGVWSVWKETTVGRATQTVDGLLSFQDKTKLDTATFYATPSTVMKRTTDGRTQISTPIYAADAATKGYVDAGNAKSGWVNGTKMPDWSGSGSYLRYRILNGGTLIEVAISAVYTAATAIAVNTTGNITNISIGQIPAEYAPGTHARSLAPGSTGRVASSAVLTNGTIQLAAVAGTTSITTGEGFTFSGMYSI